MHAFVVGDHEPTAHDVRQVLLREGHDCPAENLHVGEFAADPIAQAKPDLIVVTLSPDPDGAVGRIGLLRKAGVRCPIIAVGPSADSRLVIQTLREGAGDYVEETRLAEGLATAIRRLRALATGPAGRRTVALLAPSGGSGSTPWQ